MASKPKYKIIQSNYYDRVEREVNELLQKGWHLHGSLQIMVQSRGYGDEYYIQTMIKY